VIRLILVIVVIIPATLWHGLRMVWAVRMKRPNADCVCDSSPRRWCRLIGRTAGARVVLENAEVIDPERPQILVVNHSSWFDIIAIGSHLPGRFVFVAKTEIQKVPVFGPAIGACGHIFVDRGDHQRAMASLDVARRTLEERAPTVIMFPEGTRSASGELQPFKKGAFVLAIQTGVDVVPAAILGSRDVMRKGSLLIHPGTITVRFGAPIRVEGYGLDQRNELTDRARESLTALLAGGAA